MTEMPLSLEERIVASHVEWMREHAATLRLLDITQTLCSYDWVDEVLRDQVMASMGSRLALDAFKRGMAVIALARPQYCVLEYMGALSEHFPRSAHEPERWMTDVPRPEQISESSLVQIRLEAFGFPLAVREV